MNRRTVLGGVVAAGVGVGGYFVGNGDLDVSKIDQPLLERTAADILSGTPSTDTKIGETSSNSRLNPSIKRVEFYESGAAKVFPQASQGCNEGFVLTHDATSLEYNRDASAKTGETLGYWTFKDFDEAITISMAGKIASKTNYPSRKFKITTVSTDGACLRASGSEVFTFTVPESFMPE